MKLTLEKLYSELGYVGEIENLDEILNSDPKKEWVQEHDQIKGFKFLPIQKVEFLLSRLFENPRIKINTSELARSERSVHVTVSVIYEKKGKEFIMDGIGAAQVNSKQTIDMAFPLAKSLAIKDACDHFGKIFGRDLNRKDVSISLKKKEFTDKDEAFLNEVKAKLSKVHLMDDLDTLFKEIEATIPKLIYKDVKALFAKTRVEIM